MTLLVWLAVSSLVWGAVLYVSCLLLQRWTDASGATRQWIWRGAAALLVAPWIAMPFVSWLGLGLAPAPAPVVAYDMPPMVDALLVEVASGGPAAADTIVAATWDWEQALLLLLAVGWIARFVAAQWAARSLGGVVATSRPAEAGPARAMLGAWATKLNLRRAPELRIVAAGVSPFSFGAVRPVVCLPENLEHDLDNEALNLVIGHECLHVARGDGWLRPIERFIADIFWFNPFAWCMRRELDMARELACDEAVVAATSARKVYARTLRSVAGIAAGFSHSAPATSMSLAGGGRSMALRMSHTLAKAKQHPRRALLISAAVLGLVGAPVAVAQAVLATPRVPEPPTPPAIPSVAAAPIMLARIEPQEVPVVPPVPPASAASPRTQEVPLPPTAPAAPVPDVPPVPAKIPRIAVLSDDLAGSIISAGGPVDIKSLFPAHVKEVRTDANGQTVELIQTADEGETRGCEGSVRLLSGVKVKAGQTIAKGDLIGTTDRGAYLTLSCDQLKLGSRLYDAAQAKDLSLWLYGATGKKGLQGYTMVKPAQAFAFSGSPQAFSFATPDGSPQVLSVPPAVARVASAVRARGGLIAVPTDMRVSSIDTKSDGVTVVLKSDGKDDENRSCKMRVFGTTPVEVKKGDIIRKGQFVGGREGAKVTMSDCTLEAPRSAARVREPVSYSFSNAAPVQLEVGGGQKVEGLTLVAPE